MKPFAVYFLLFAACINIDYNFGLHTQEPTILNATAPSTNPLTATVAATNATPIITASSVGVENVTASINVSTGKGRQVREVPSLTELCQKKIGKYLGKKFGNNQAGMRKYLKDNHVPEHLVSPIIRFGMQAALQHQNDIVAAPVGSTGCNIQ